MRIAGYTVSLVLLCLGVFSSCKKTFDTDEPVISWDTATVEFYLLSDDSLLLPVSIFDSIGLFQYKVSVVLSPHSKLIDSTRSNEKLNVWSYLNIGELTENSASFLVNVRCIDANPLPGIYYLILSATDDSYNLTADTVVVHLRQAVDTVAPQLDLISPTSGQNYITNDTMKVVAYVPDYNSAGAFSGIWECSVKLVPTFAGQGTLPITSLSNMETDSISVVHIWRDAHLPGTYLLRFVMRDHYNNLDSADIAVVKN